MQMSIESPNTFHKISQNLTFGAIGETNKELLD